MRLGWFTTFRSSFYALLLHVVAVGLLVISLDLTPEPVHRPHKDINIVNAVSVDKSAVDREIEKLKQADKEKQEKEQKRIAELEKKAEEMRQQRLEEEKKLAAARKKKEQEEQERLEEQKKMAQLEKEKAELERQRKIEQEKKREAELERKRQEAARLKAEEEKRKAAEERRRLEEEKRKAAEELEKKKAEEALQEQLAAELAEERAAEQNRQDQKLIQNIKDAIDISVSKNFNKTGLPNGLSCKISVTVIPGGEVMGVKILESSGNDIFDRRARTAVNKASPLPIPDDPATLDRLNLREITFTFKPQD